MKKYILIGLTIAASHCNAQTTVIDSIFYGGQYRSYIAYIPAIYNGNTAVPLLYNLHGYTSNAAQQIYYGDFRPIADTANFIVVQPNGTFSQGLRFWNAFYQGPPNDLAFLNALVDSLKLSYSIDENRLYMCGMSNGGIMSYYVACDPNNRFAAVGSVTGTMDTAFFAGCNPSRPTPVIEIHGDADGTVPFGGGASFVAIDTVMKYWSNVNGTNNAPMISNYPDIVLNDFCTATEYAYLNGINNSEAVLVKINGGAHTWPGASIIFAVTNQDFSASVRIWNFFRRYKKNLLSGISESLPVTDELKIYPNPSQTTISIQSSSNRKKEIMIFDMYGNSVKTISSVDAQKPIYIGNLASGIYTVVAGSSIIKFIKY